MAKTTAAQRAATTTKISELSGAFLRLLGKFARAGVLSGTLAVAPVPASRPRVSRWGTYYSKTYQRWKTTAETLAQDIKAAKVTGPVCLVVEQVCALPKTSGRDYPQGDFDNHAKGPADALTKAQQVWADDDQVVACLVTKRFAKPDEEPCTNLWWCELETRTA